jgi:hypothetical protein
MCGQLQPSVTSAAKGTEPGDKGKMGKGHPIHSENFSVEISKPGVTGAVIYCPTLGNGICNRQTPLSLSSGWSSEPGIGSPFPQSSTPMDNPPILAYKSLRGLQMCPQGQVGNVAQEV